MDQQATAPCRREIASIADVPESTQKVFCALYGHDPMTGADLREETGMPRRTLYAALQRLREIGVLKEQPSLRDTRQTYFWLDDVHASIAA